MTLELCSGGIKIQELLRVSLYLGPKYLTVWYGVTRPGSGVKVEDGGRR